jgi:hypothetical protein
LAPPGLRDLHAHLAPSDCEVVGVPAFCRIELRRAAGHKFIVELPDGRREQVSTRSLLWSGDEPRHCEYCLREGGVKGEQALAPRRAHQQRSERSRSVRPARQLPLTEREAAAGAAGEERLTFILPQTPASGSGAARPLDLAGARRAKLDADLVYSRVIGVMLGGSGEERSFEDACRQVGRMIHRSTSQVREAALVVARREDALALLGIDAA